MKILQCWHPSHRTIVSSDVLFLLSSGQRPTPFFTGQDSRRVCTASPPSSVRRDQAIHCAKLCPYTVPLTTAFRSIASGVVL